VVGVILVFLNQNSSFSPLVFQEYRVVESDARLLFGGLVEDLKFDLFVWNHAGTQVFYMIWL
jgi:hypothetical protein